MWLRSERISRRLRGRLSLSGVSASKGTSHRTQLSTARKLPSINSTSRVITSGRCGRLSQWRRRSSNFLKEVSCDLYMKVIFNCCIIRLSYTSKSDLLPSSVLSLHTLTVNDLCRSFVPHSLLKQTLQNSQHYILVNE